MASLRSTKWRSNNEFLRYPCSGRGTRDCRSRSAEISRAPWLMRFSRYSWRNASMGFSEAAL
jgi:hypothetical protein